LFLASKFAVTIPFLAPAGYAVDASSFSAFPSRLANTNSAVYESVRSSSSNRETLDPTATKRVISHEKAVTAVRRQAAAPPVYLLFLTVLPFFGAVFVASSRWFDFRHHGFDIMFGFLIGTITSIFSFRYYHLPISQGAGWGWGPRSHDKAFWAGIGSYSYATDHKKYFTRPGDEEEAIDVRDSARGTATVEQRELVGTATTS
jgi:hypothetical protein